MCTVSQELEQEVAALKQAAQQPMKASLYMADDAEHRAALQQLQDVRMRGRCRVAQPPAQQLDAERVLHARALERVELAALQQEQNKELKDRVRSLQAALDEVARELAAAQARVALLGGQEVRGWWWSLLVNEHVCIDHVR